MPKHLTFKEIWLPLIILSGSHFMIDFMIGVWPIFKTLTSLDLPRAGLITAIAVIFGEGMQLVFGPLCDLGYRRQILQASLLLSAGACFYSYGESLWFLGLLLFLTCLGSGAFHPSAAGIVGGLTSKQKGFFVTCFASAGAFGLASSQIAYSFLYKAGEGKTFWLAAFPLVFFLILLFGMKKNKNSPLLKKEFRLIPFSEIKFFFSNKRLSLLYLLQVSSQTVIWALTFLLSDLLMERGYNEWLCFGGGYFFVFLGGGLMMVPSGYLADKKSPKAVLLASVLSGAVFFYSFLYFNHLPDSLVGLLLAATGACLSIVNPVAVSFGYRILPEKPGLVGAVSMGLVWVVSEGLGQGGAGLLTGLFETEKAALALSLIGLLFLPSIIAALCLPVLEKTDNLELLKAS